MASIYSVPVKSFRVDLRSDTVTKPSAAMRRAMAEAEVGDDWFGDDPTVNRLQERAAEITGKEAALFVPSGTMANQIALRLQFSGPGHLVVAEPLSHVASTEVMSSAVLSGIAYRTVHGDRRGRITADQVRAALEPDEPYDVEIVDLVCLENTSGHAGGTVMDVEDFRAIRKVAEEAGVAVHLDGARIFNASAASGVDVAEYAAEVDTLMFCVSKGLGAPIGSLVCGTRRADAGRPEDQDPVRRCLAAGGGRGGRRPGGARGGAEAPRRGPRARPPARRGRGRDRAGEPGSRRR